VQRDTQARRVHLHEHRVTLIPVLASPATAFLAGPNYPGRSEKSHVSGRKLGLARVVVDGAVRDCLELHEIGSPVFAFGANPNGPTKSIGGRINHPVSVRGVMVCPGDYITANADGVVVVEKWKIASLLPLAEKKVADEAKRIAAIAQGATSAPWLDGPLRAAGVLREGERLSFE
jgi:4-hydroxy-4-methyl-2-oxoglutarate aldolase